MGRPYQLPIGLTLDKDLTPSGLIMSTAQGQKLLSPNAWPLPGESITVGMEKMLEWFVKVPITHLKSWGKLSVSEPGVQVLHHK